MRPRKHILPHLLDPSGIGALAGLPRLRPASRAGGKAVVVVLRKSTATPSARGTSRPTSLAIRIPELDRALLDVLVGVERHIAASRGQFTDIQFPLPPTQDSENPAFHDGLAVHIAQTARKHLELLAHWLETQSRENYATCQESGSVRAAALGRVGRSVRRILDAEALAERLVSGLDLESQPWGRRFSDARTGARAARARVAFFARQIDACANPLGFADSDLPMYYKYTVDDSPHAAYFGSSKFLLDKAQTHRERADGRLSEARTAWLALSNAVYEGELREEDRLRRISQIKEQHESTLTELCGKPNSSSTTPILDVVLTPEGVNYDQVQQCFINRPSCNPGLPLSSMPATCLRGRVGEQVLALQSALLTTTSARNALERAQEQYNEMGMRCSHKQEFYAENERILGQFTAEMEKWRERKVTADTIGAAARAASECATDDSWFSFGGHCVAALAAGAAEIASVQFQEKMADAEDTYRQTVERRANQEDVRDCWFEADQQKHVIDAQYDSLRQTSQAILGVRLELDNTQNLLSFVAEQAQAAIAVENDLHVDAPQHHFWFDEKIEEYQWSFAWAKRLTYLAMLSAEYELQRSLGRRGPILAAKRPFDLEQQQEALLGMIENGTANGHDIEFQPLVLSLRQQILRLAPAPHSSPAERTAAEIAAFQEYLQSNASIIYQSDGRRLGRGVRFSMAPMAQTFNLCAERFWRPSGTRPGHLDDIERLRRACAAWALRTRSACRPCSAHRPTGRAGRARRPGRARAQRSRRRAAPSRGTA